MEQVYRIEIPVEAIDVTDAASLRNLETTLQRIFTSAARGKGTIKDTLDAINNGSANATSSLHGLENAVDEAADSFDQVGSAAQDAGTDAEQSATEAGSAAEDLGDSVKEAGDSYKETGSSARQAGEKADSAFNKATSSTDKFTQRVEKTNRTLAQMFKEKLSLTMQAIDKASPVLRTISNTVKGLAGKAWHVAVRMKDFVTAPFRKLYNMISSPITIALTVAGIGLGASDIIPTYKDFTAGMSTVRALTRATDEDFKLLTDTAKELGATTKFTATEASEGMKYLAMAGWDTADIIDAMPGLLNLAAAGATDLGTAADIVSDVMTAMGMTADQAGRAADIFARAATSSNTTVEGLGNTMKYAAPIAHGFGMSLEDVAAAAALMANAGIKGEMAGTALRASLLRMSSPTSEMQKTMDALGVSFTDSAGKMKSMRDIVRMLETSFSGLTESQRLAYAQDLFGTEAASAWLGIISQGADAYDQMADSLYDCAGAAAEMANTQLDNLAGDMTLLQSAVDGMKINLMERLGPYARQGVQWLTSKIPAITDFISNGADKIISKVKEIKDHISDVFNSQEFQNADGFAEKFMIAWDKIIAEPFSKWWNGEGRAKVAGIASEIGGEIGQLIHGVVIGAWAAIKGEEVDYSGMNLTGMAQAGAEAAKNFVSSFASSLDFGNIISEAPGGLKALAFGFSGVKIGSGLLGTARTFGQLKMAFSGVTATASTAAGATTGVGTAAVTAATGAGKAAAIFGSLKTVLAAIPAWGWIAAAAIAAVATGVKLYNDAQERHRQELLDTGKAAQEMGEQYEENVSNIREALNTFDRIKEIQLKIKEADGNSEVLSQFQETLQTEISDRTAEVKLIMTQSGLTPEEADEYANELVRIFTRQAEIEVMMNGAQLSSSEIAQYKAELDGIQSRKAVITASLSEGGLSKKEIEDLSTEYAKLETKEAAITLMLQGSQLDQEGLAALAEEYAKLETKTVAITAKMAEGGMQESDIKNVVDTLSEIGDKTAVLTFSISTDGLSQSDLEQYNAELGSLYENLVTLSGGRFTQEDVDRGRITQEVFDNWIQQQEIIAENQRRDFATQVRQDAENIPELIERRDAAQAQADYHDQMASASHADKEFLEQLEVQRQTVLSRYRAGEIDDDELFESGAEIIQAAREHQWADMWGAPMNFDAFQPDMLFGEYKGGFLGIGSHWEADPSINPFGSGLEELRRQVEAQDSSNDTSGSEAAGYNDALLRQYQNEVRVQELNSFAGFGVQSEYSTETIEGLASSYADLDSAGQQMFANAIAGIAQVNEAATYVSEEQKVNIGAILEQAQQSVTISANVEVIGDVQSSLQQIAASYQGLEGDQAAAFNTENIEAVNAALESLGLDKIESLDQIDSALEAIAGIDPSGLDFSAAVSSLEALGGNADSALAKVNSVKSQLEALAKTYYVTINVTRTGSTGLGLAAEAVSMNAEGGIYDGAFLSLVAEDGPEAIIPLGAKRRERGLDLWRQAGKMLGVSEYAEGGLLSPYAGALESLPDEAWNNDGGDQKNSPLLNDGGSGSRQITVQVSANPTYNIDGSKNPEDVLAALKNHQRELAELLGGVFADELEDIVSNMV